MVKDCSDSERKHPMLAILWASLSSYAPSLVQNNTYHSFVIPVVEHQEGEIQKSIKVYPTAQNNR